MEHLAWVVGILMLLGVVLSSGCVTAVPGRSVYVEPAPLAYWPPPFYDPYFGYPHSYHSPLMSRRHPPMRRR